MTFSKNAALTSDNFEIAIILSQYVTRQKCACADVGIIHVLARLQILHFDNYMYCVCVTEQVLTVEIDGLVAL